MYSVEERDSPIRSSYSIQWIPEVSRYRPRVLLRVPFRLRSHLQRTDLEWTTIVRPERELQVPVQFCHLKLKDGQVQGAEQCLIPPKVENDAV